MVTPAKSHVCPGCGAKPIPGAACAACWARLPADVRRLVLEANRSIRNSVAQLHHAHSRVSGWFAKHPTGTRESTNAAG